MQTYSYAVTCIKKRYQPEVANDFDFESGLRWERDIHLINGGTFCHTVVENTDGYMDRKKRDSLLASWHSNTKYQCL